MTASAIMSDDLDGIAAISRAFRSASDEDIRVAMNTLSSRNLLACKWYVVPSAWMKLAWPLLMEHQAPSPSWRQELAIENKHLVAGVDSLAPVNESDGDQRQQFQQKNALLSELRFKQKQSSSSSFQLKSSCVHERDFFLLGGNAWLLCKHKFGCDYEIECPTVENRSDRTTPLLVSVPLAGDESIRIPFPTTGRFAVEAMLRKSDNDMDESLAQSHPGNVSDDEHDDLFPDLVLPGNDGEMSMSNPQDVDATRDTILLLPPSTTDTTSPLPYIGGQVGVGNDDLVGSDVVRRKPHGTGLGNLGNTCFMNSTLQCLAHTDPLRKYFLSGEYVDDLNRNNPLGTRGELAIQFASLLGELWTTAGGSKDFGSRFSGSAVYPRAFKQTLGRHAEQFVGYDQHDSQELAIYLLDALHEDTNRVTNKPYVEKPEKEDNQSDEEASQKAWELHLKRDDSKVQSFFMGQVKSRVQCCKPECGRVSTTFEPCMYLSVPIPGSLEKSVDVTFVPLDPSRRPRRVSLSVNKSGSFKDLLVKLLLELKSHSIVGFEESIAMEDLCAVDVFQNSFYKWYKAEDLVDIVRENDKTFVYQLLPIRDDQKSGAETGLRVDISHLNLREWEPQLKRFKLDDSTREKLSRGDEWMQQFTKYLRYSNNLNFERAFNPSRGSSLDRAEWYNKTQRYLSLTNKTLLKSDSVTSAKGDVAFNVTGESTKTPIDGLCSTSPTFEDVNSTYDVAVLDFCLEKMREAIVRLEQPTPEIPKEGVIIEIRLRNAGTFSSKDVSVPFALRIPPDMTVYQLRERLAKSLHRCLRTGRSAEPPNMNSASVAMATVDSSADAAWSEDFGSPELFIIRQLPLAYERKTYSSSARSHAYSSSTQLGSVGKESRRDGRTSLNIANPKDEAENAIVARLVGDHGSVIMDWPEVLFEQHFNLGEYETVDVLVDPDEPPSKSSVSVMDCIAKYCQMEQLEESDMWYCNRCREHVQAWKSVDLYLAPPILFIHLKRFHFSASTHRRDKIGIFIDFPLKGLDLTAKVSHWTEEEKPIYDCFAVSNHFGGLGGGHYTAYCLNDDGSWAYYDDSRVTTNVDPKDVVSAAAYCLYYRRRDVQSGEDFAIDLQTPSIHAPIVIPDVLYGRNSPHDDCEISSTNAAMVDDEDGMDLDDVDNASRSTSPMGSIEDHIEREHLDDNDIASDCQLLQ